MSDVASLDMTEGWLHLSGSIGADNAERVMAEGVVMLKQMPGDWQVDVADLLSSSSVTVAVMLGWLRAAGKAGRSLVFRGISGRLADIIRVSGLESVIPRAGAADGF